MLETCTTLSSWMGPLAIPGETLAEASGAGFAPPPAAAARMSALTMRPPGPLPAIPAGLTPFSAATFRASGEILIRPPASGAGAGAGAGTEAGAGAGAGAGPGAGDAGAAAAFASGAAGAGWAGGAGGEEAEAGAAASGALDAGASTFSPGFPMAQRAAPSGTWAPACTNIESSVPSKKLSSSIVALSVSTSASMSPVLTVSPSFLSHLTSVPTVMVSLNFGISMMLAMVSPAPRSPP